MMQTTRTISACPQRWLRCVAASFACLSLLAVAADTKPKSAAVAKPKKSVTLKESLDKLLARPELKGAQVGLHVVRLSDGKDLFSHQADRLFVPASNEKLLTTAAALIELGPDYQFRTLVGTVGRDLVVVGGGDPTISGRFTDGDPTIYFRRWAKVLKDQRVTQIAGDLVVDDSFFDRQLVHPNWPKNDLGHWYAAPIGALALNDDCIDVRIAPASKPDAPAKVSLIPDTRYFEIVNRTRTVSSSKDHAPRVVRGPAGRVIQCDGGVYQRSQPSTSWVTVDDPTLYFATVLREVFAEEGVTIAGRTRRGPGIGRSKEFKPRVVHRFPLLPALAVTNKESQNFYAEQILKTLGAEHGDGSWVRGRELATQALSTLGLDSKSYVLDDGCGLSRTNRASPRAFITLLRAMHRGPYGEQFRGTLSVAGVDGTLSKRLTDDRYRGRVWAKTGSITGVRAISGYARTRSGQWLAFSFLVNNARVSVRTLQDDLCKTLVDCDEDSNLVSKNRGQSK
jgi:D-alanyl-D-alanine carboxypeptidase/D-alanyl-D-alanine-endopeptidase (penicillin-binding protein 4)